MALAERFRIQKETIVAAIDLLEFMRAQQGHFQHQETRLLFDTQDKLVAYNQHIQRIQSLALQESEWLENQRSFALKQIHRIKTTP